MPRVERRPRRLLVTKAHLPLPRRPPGPLHVHQLPGCQKSSGTGYMRRPIQLAFAAEMSRVNPAELPGSMAVLGIVIEQPNDTVTHIGQCLGRRFTRARFARSTAHSTLPRLARAERVHRTHQAPGSDRSKDRYEATSGGLEVFRAWMFEQPSATPALRDAMYGRIEGFRLEDLFGLIEMKA